MRMLRVAVLLGLAGLAWKKLQPKFPAIKAHVAAATNKLQSVSKDGAESVRDASLSVADASLSVAETADSVAHAIPEPASTR